MTTDLKEFDRRCNRYAKNDAGRKENYQKAAKSFTLSQRRFDG